MKDTSMGFWFIDLRVLFLFAIILGNNFVSSHSISFGNEKKIIFEPRHLDSEKNDTDNNGTESIVEAPEGCSGTINILSNIHFGLANFEIDCEKETCSQTRDIIKAMFQEVNEEFPQGSVFSKAYSGEATIRPFGESSNCNETTNQQQLEIGVELSELVYNYSVKILDGTEYTVTRTFAYLGNAALIINGDVVTNITADNLLVQNQVSVNCSLLSPCNFPINADPLSPYLGNEYLRFYYEVPTFIINLSVISDTISSLCSDNFSFIENEEAICMNGPFPIGPCIGNDVHTEVSASAKNGLSFCESNSTENPSSIPSTTPSPTPSKENSSSSMAIFSPIALVVSILINLISSF